MTHVEQTRLPGVGIRHDFTTESGRRLGLLTHLSGRRDLLLYDAADPDTTVDTVRLAEEDVRVLSELLGSDHVTEQIAGIRRQSSSGIEFDWLPVERGSPNAGTALGELGLDTEHGLTPVAVLRAGEAIPGPGRDFELAVGDTVVVAGTPDAVRGALERIARR